MLWPHLCNWTIFAVGCNRLDDLLGPWMPLQLRVSCEDGHRLPWRWSPWVTTRHADFPAIYGDLFEQQTFDPANGGWRYDVQPSYCRTSATVTHQQIDP